MTEWSTEPAAAGEGRCASILLFGQSGVGKSLACVRLPAPVAWIAIENGALESVWARGYRPSHVVVRTYADALDAIFDLRGRIDKALKKGEPLPARSVVLDSITSAEDATTEELVSQGGKGIVQDTRPEVLSQGGYGVLGGRHRAIREAILRIPALHKCFIALPKVQSDDGLNRGGSVVPGISGQQGARFPAYCNWVFYLETYKMQGRVRRRVRTRHEGVIFAKDRLGVLQPEEDAGLALILEKGRFLNGNEQYHLRNGGLGDRAASDRDWQSLAREDIVGGEVA